MMKKKIVIVGMSGGVDSSVTALLLKQAGFDVIGLFMKNWEEKEGLCRGAEDFEDVLRVCDKLGIPCYSVNFVQEYWDHVFAHFLEELKQGYTPNPDILCNREIKFQALLQKAFQLGGDYLATGHYCQTSQNTLLKGLDPGKDQSYFLYTLKSSILQNVLFPIGHLLKTQVRQIAADFQLPTAHKKDSTGICFIGKRNFKSFIKDYIPYQPGPILTLEGKQIGTHEGIAYHTIGQRKGLGIGGPGDAWFIVKKDPKNNIIYVAQGEDHPALFANALIASDSSWVSKPPTFPLHCKAKIRYRQEDQACTVFAPSENTLHVEFATPQRAITPRQSIVFYDGPLCLGGAMISHAIPNT